MHRLEKRSSLGHWTDLDVAAQARVVVDEMPLSLSKKEADLIPMLVYEYSSLRQLFTL